MTTTMTTDRMEQGGDETGSTRLKFPFDRTRDGHRQSDEKWNRFKGNVGGTSERRGGAHSYPSAKLSECITILNRAEQMMMMMMTMKRKENGRPVSKHGA